MAPHDELDQLSAYIDGELEAHEHARIEAHLPGCAECRTTLDALRATVAALTELPEPVPTEQDSWALRSAIARARKPVRRWQRAAVAAGSLAAAMVAVLAFALSGGGGGGFRASQAPERSALGAGPAAVPVFTSSQNFSLQAAHTHLLEVSGKVPPGATRPLSSDMRSSTSQPAAGGAAPEAQGFPLDASAPNEKVKSQIDRCVNVVRRSTQVLLTPVRYEVVTFESKPAFFLIFSTQERFELWVVTRDRCEVLYFAQTA
jgi:hypothetical protein